MTETWQQKQDDRNDSSHQDFTHPEIKGQTTAGKHPQTFGFSWLICVSHGKSIPETEIQISNQCPSSKNRKFFRKFIVYPDVFIQAIRQEGNQVGQSESSDDCRKDEQNR